MIAGCEEDDSGIPRASRLVTTASSRYTASTPSRSSSSGMNRSRGTSANAAATRGDASTSSARSRSTSCRRRRRDRLEVGGDIGTGSRTLAFDEPAGD